MLFAMTRHQEFFAHTQHCHHLQSPLEQLSEAFTSTAVSFAFKTRRIMIPSARLNPWQAFHGCICESNAQVTSCRGPDCSRADHDLASSFKLCSCTRGSGTNGPAARDVVVKSTSKPCTRTSDPAHISKPREGRSNEATIAFRLGSAQFSVHEFMRTFK